VSKIVRFNSIGGPNVLEITEEQLAAPKDNEVLVDIKAAGLNRAEYLYMQGLYLVEPKLPSRIGVEGSGVIEAVGSNVTSFEVGQEVSITPNMSPAEYGVIGEKAIIPVQALAPKSPDISFEEAAAIWMAFPTAYGGLVEVGGLKQGEEQYVVVSAASSSVGLPAIQIAKNHGAKVIATSRDFSKRNALLDAGADHVIATSEEDFAARVMEITEGHGFDIAFDPIGGPFLETLADGAAVEATIVVYGALAMSDTSFPLFPAIGKGLRVCGFHLVYNLFDHVDRTERAMAHLGENLANGKYKPIIDRVFPLSEVAQAYEHMAGGEQIGKIIVSGS
jgi:NADPH:quinone reductase-like Zn-dependent oxidoreductase